MGLDIWFKEDIANILRAAEAANLSAMIAADQSGPETTEADADRLRQAYRDGFSAALATVALALGLPAPVRTGDADPQADGAWEVPRLRVPRRIDPPRR